MAHIKTLFLLTMLPMHATFVDVLHTLECHDRVVQHGIETLRFPQEVEAIVGATNVDHFISSFGSRTHGATWNSVAYFGGRYWLSLKADILIDYDNCQVKGKASSITVYLNEVTGVTISTSGIAEARLKGGIAEFTESQWKRLVMSGGDWSVVNVLITMEAPPIKNFDEFVKQARAPIRNRKEGFDEPIRKARQALRDGTYLKTNPPPPECHDGLDCYEKVLCYGSHYILPKEFESFFGPANVDHLISEFESDTQTPMWHSVAYFAGRYRAVMRFPLSINYKTCKPNGALNSALINIDEIVNVEIGTPRVKIKGHWEINENEWKWLLKNNGDWSVVKLPIVTNAPVKNFDKYVKQERARPVGARQDDFDKPIRRAIDAIPYPKLQ